MTTTNMPAVYDAEPASGCARVSVLLAQFRGAPFDRQSGLQRVRFGELLAPGPARRGVAGTRRARRRRPGTPLVQMGGALRNLGEMWRRGKGGLADAARARELNEKSCNMGWARGCNDLALLWEAGEGGTKDASIARVLFETACTGGFMLACQSLGGAWLHGEGGPADPVQARAWLQKACDGDVGTSCGAIEVMNEKGLGGPVDPAAAGMLIQEDLPARGGVDVPARGKGDQSRDRVCVVLGPRARCRWLAFALAASERICARRTSS